MLSMSIRFSHDFPNQTSAHSMPAPWSCSNHLPPILEHDWSSDKTAGGLAIVGGLYWFIQVETHHVWTLVCSHMFIYCLAIAQSCFFSDVTNMCEHLSLDISRWSSVHVHLFADSACMIHHQISDIFVGDGLSITVRPGCALLHVYT